MGSRFTLRMQFGPHQDAEMVQRELLDLVRSTPVDEIMFFAWAEEMNSGHEMIERVREWMAFSRPIRRALAREGVAISLNPWHSLLHADWNTRRKPGQDWQRMAGPDGTLCETQVCPLDRQWQTYYEEVLRTIAREKFRVVWIDDDIRYHNHHPLEWGGCFCDLHVREFCRRAGVNATRRSIVAACTAPGRPHPWRTIWFDMWQETLRALIIRWRRIMERRGIRLGLMSSLVEKHAAEGRCWEDWWKAFGGRRPAIHRPHFGAYSDVVGRSLPEFIARLDQNRAVQQPGMESGPELEGCPYNPWHVPFRLLFAESALSHILGSTHLNSSLSCFTGTPPSDEPEKWRFLRKIRPALDFLADAFPLTLQPVGIGIPWSQDMSRNLRTEKGGSWFALECPTRGWANWLAAVGRAFAMRRAGNLNAIAGPVAWDFSDAVLRDMLSCGLLLDGPAALVMIKRGFGPLIGFRSGRLCRGRIDDLVYTTEHGTDPDFSLHTGSTIPMRDVNHQPYAAAVFQGMPAGGAREISDLRDAAFRRVGHGTMLFENEQGGRVAVFPGDVNRDVFMKIHRSIQFNRVVDWLAAGRSTGSVSGRAWLVPQFLTDGRIWRGAVWNACADAITAFEVTLPAGMRQPARAWQFAADGCRLAVPFNNGRVRLRRPLHQWEFVVLV